MADTNTADNNVFGNSILILTKAMIVYNESIIIHMLYKLKTPLKFSLSLYIYIYLLKCSKIQLVLKIKLTVYNDEYFYNFHSFKIYCKAV
jgi:hypothetical protein